jgi:hypothetical protein
VPPLGLEPQSVEGESFELATEFGVPTALREPADYLRLGYNFQDDDNRLGATWKWLRSATAEQVTAQVTRIFEADNRLVSGTILRRPLDPAPRFNEWQHTCYGLRSGDGMVPPDHLGQTFDNARTHYLASGSTHIDSADIDDMIKHVVHHGYGRFGSQGGQGGQGGQLIILAHPNQVEDMTFWRAGVEYAAGKTPKWDRGLYHRARRQRRQAKAAYIEACARRWSPRVALTSACGQDKRAEPGDPPRGYPGCAGHVLEVAFPIAMMSRNS